VFFTLSQHKTLNTKVAQHIKLPYVGRSYNNKSINTDFKPYKRTYNSMYYVKKGDYTTYFTTNNNLLTYNTVRRNEVVMFLPDLLNNSYKLIKSTKLNITNLDENSYLVKTANGKLYLISRHIIWYDKKEYAAGIDIKSGKSIFMISKENETLLHLLYPIMRNIMPVLQFKPKNISINLVDLISDKVGVIEWNLMNIRQLIIDLLRLGEVSISQKKEILDDKIRYFYIKKDEYMDVLECDVQYEWGEDTSGDSYIKSIKVTPTLIIDGEKYAYCLESPFIKMEVDNNKIVCYWNVTNAKLKVYKKLDHEGATKNEIYFEVQPSKSIVNVRMLQRSYSLRAQEDYKYTPKDLLIYSYENECYRIIQHNEGIMIREKASGNVPLYAVSSLYKYGKYLIIIQDYMYSKIVFIDRGKNLIYKFVIYIDQFICPRYRFTYHYYPFYKSNKIIFLSKDLQCLMIVDMNKVDYFISLYDSRNCKEVNIKNIKV
jgi:hypothetical protein